MSQEDGTRNEAAQGPVIHATGFKPTQDTVDQRAWLQRYRSQLLWGLVGLVVLWFIWFIFTAKSVRIVTDPLAADLTIAGGFDLELGGVSILREGNYQLRAEAEGRLHLGPAWRLRAGYLFSDAIVEETGLRFRDIPDLQVDGIQFSTFFGGSGPDWAPLKDEHIDFGNLRLYDAPPWEGGGLSVVDPL